MATELKASQKVSITEVSFKSNNNRNFNLFSRKNPFSRNFFRQKQNNMNNRNYKRQGR
jgi:hypothetical protein